MKKITGTEAFVRTETIVLILLIVFCLAWGTALYHTCSKIEQRGLKYYFEEIWEGKDAHK